MNSLSLSAEKEKITHDRTGKLQDLAVEYFQRAYGLGDRPREDHNALCEEAVEVTQCSRRAFRELIYGHSYQAILGPLREMVPGYKPKLPKREQREQQMQELEQLSLSGSPPKDDMNLAAMPRPSFKLSSSAPPFESPKLLPQPPHPGAKFLTTLTPSSSVVSPMGPLGSREPSMTKPKLADRVLTSPERKPKTSGTSPEPMELAANSYGRNEYESGSQPRWGDSPASVWPSPAEASRRDTPPKPVTAAPSQPAAHLSRPTTKEDAAVSTTANVNGGTHGKKESVAAEEKAKTDEKEIRKVESKTKEEQSSVREEKQSNETEASAGHQGKESEKKEDTHSEKEQEAGVIEEALKEKGTRILRQDKTSKSRTPRPFRSPQLAPSLFSSPIQPLPSSSQPSSTTATTAASSTSSPLATVFTNLSRFGVCGKGALGALLFCLLRQYVFHVGNYSGRVPVETLFPLLVGSMVLLGIFLARVLHVAIKTRQLPLAIAEYTEDYIEAWELLHVGGDSRELVHALQQIQLLLESLIQGLDVFQPNFGDQQGGINHSMRLLDYLSSIHRKLAGDIGNTVLVMRLVDSLRRMRMSLLKLCLTAETALPLLESLSGSVVAINAVCLLVIVQSSSALVEILLLPAFIYILALFHLLLTSLDSPFSSVVPLNLEALTYIQKRVQNRITQLQKVE